MRTRMVNAAAASLLLIVLCLYPLSYVALSSRELMGAVVLAGDPIPEPRQTRIFQSKWQAKLFTPALIVESLLIGEEIDAYNPEE